MTLLVELPTELLDHILKSANCLSDLRALSITSRRIYSVFRIDRAGTIYRVLAVELGPDVLCDALGLSHIQALDGKSKDKAAYRHQFQDALSVYGAYLAGQRSNNPLVPLRLPLDCVLRLVSTYRDVAFLTDVFISCAIRLFDRELRPSCQGADDFVADLVAPPSRSEWLRVLRAYYRLQIVLLFWGSRARVRTMFWGSRARVRRPEDLHVQDPNFCLFGLWETWEVHQWFCASAFYHRIRWALTPNLGHQDPWTEALNKLPRSRWFDQFRGVVELVRTVDENAWQCTLDEASSFPSGGSVAAGNNEEARLVWFRTRLCQFLQGTGLPERHRFPVALRFEGDRVSTVPFGWVDAFDGQYEWDFCGSQRGFRRMRQPIQGLWSRTGLIMWDKPRVEVLKTSALLSHVATGWARSPVYSP